MLPRRFQKYLEEMEAERKKEDFIERVNEEYDAFRLETLTESKESIYGGAFKIYFYLMLADYLMDDDNVSCLNEEMLENDCPLASLWLYHRKNNWESIDGEENICQMIKDFCESERSAA